MACKTRVEGIRKDDTVGFAVPGLATATSPSAPYRGLGSHLGIQTRKVGEFSAGPSDVTKRIANRMEHELRYENAKSMSPPPRPDSTGGIVPKDSRPQPSPRIRDISPSRVMREALRHVDERQRQIERNERVANEPRFAERCMETDLCRTQNRQDLATFRRRERNRTGAWGYETIESPPKPRYQPGL